MLDMIVRDSCQVERDKFDMEAHLQKAHGIHVVLPQGMKIEEEELMTSWKSMATSFFND